MKNKHTNLKDKYARQSYNDINSDIHNFIGLGS